MNLPQADFLTTAEFHRGPDILRPGTLTGKQVDPCAIAFIYTLFPYEGNEPDIRVKSEDRHLIYWPAPMGHEKAADREPVLKALFGPDFREATKDVAYEQQIYEEDDQGNLKSPLTVVSTKLAYDAIELRRLANQKNLFGRYGRVRGVLCLMLWNACENWEKMAEKVLVLLEVPYDGLMTLGNCEQWWVRGWRGR